VKPTTYTTELIRQAGANPAWGVIKSKTVDNFLEKASSAPRFFVGDGRFSLEEPDPNARLPFECVVLELELGPALRDQWLVVAEHLPVTSPDILIGAFWNVDGLWAPSPLAAFVKRQQGIKYGVTYLKNIVVPDEGFYESSLPNTEWIAGMVMAFVAATSKPGAVQRIETQTALHAQITSSAPISSDEYRVLRVCESAPSKAGTDSRNAGRSPRGHLRRGHLRRIGDGKTVWVKPTKVNPAAAGQVHKDYDLRHP
jgi:hypothetical protein